ncbi:MULTISPECIES: hypothetical protein [Halorussus]|uniref:hypothetical protein n=1 Tax=Halorussus TaxID=1070314 RepID=UPI0013B3E949|nr:MULTISPECIES: hypothetical protein [Halorussus]NHN59623.1 hypothetical protein [Halorussus sp. JP-T4]
MIAPCREYWWREVLPGEENWRGPHINLNLVDRIVDKEEIPPLAAIYIVRGSLKDNILSGVPGIYYEGVNHIDNQEDPEWLTFAKDIERDGVTKLPWGEDTISIDGPQLIHRASERARTDDLHFNHLVLHIHHATGLELGVAKDRVERFIENGVIEQDDGVISISSQSGSEKATSG